MLILYLLNNRKLNNYYLTDLKGLKKTFKKSKYISLSKSDLKQWTKLMTSTEMRTYTAAIKREHKTILNAMVT